MIALCSAMFSPIWIILVFHVLSGNTEDVSISTKATKATTEVPPSSSPFPIVAARSLQNGDKEDNVGPIDCSSSLDARRCLFLPNETCLGARLPYSWVSFDLTGLEYIYQAKAELREKWSFLEGIAPKCWAVVRPLLCAVYMPGERKRSVVQ